MAHLIDTTTGIAAIAYAGGAPWHGLGQNLSKNASIQEWTRQAGLDWNVQRSQVGYRRGDGSKKWTPFKDREVLFRDDTGAALGVVSNSYKVVQPADVMGFFDELTKIAGFTLETAGALYDGKRIWALAKIGDGAAIVGHDIVRPYLLLTTSYDGSMSTTAKLTAIRVVCNNTLSISINRESDVTDKVISSKVSVPHNETFCGESVRKKLGIFENDFDKWLLQTKVIAEQEINLDVAGKMTAELMSSILGTAKNGNLTDVVTAKGYLRVMELFDGGAIGSDLSQGLTKWQWLNSVTQWVDYERGRSNDSRLNSAWFGTGDGIKKSAYALVLAGT